jgi:hypothetical protein
LKQSIFSLPFSERTFLGALCDEDKAYRYQDRIDQLVASEEKGAKTISGPITSI